MSKLESIKSVEVNRDDCGMWCHPDFPSWDEGVDISVINNWFTDNGGTYYIDTLEDSDDEEVIENWYGIDNFNCLKWEPKCNKYGSFLLSIHDTDDGPIAAFFVPIPMIKELINKSNNKEI